MIKLQETAPIVIPQPPNGGIPITLPEARRRHIGYLQHGPHLFVANGKEISGDEKILHSLHINQEDLELLYRNAKNGIRLHLCREDSGMLNIIAVPVCEEGQLVIDEDPERGIRPIVNTLEPCPSLCTPLFSEKNLNCWVSEDGQRTWVDPNDEQDGKIWFVKDPDGKKKFVEKPDDAPEHGNR